MHNFFAILLVVGIICSTLVCSAVDDNIGYSVLLTEAATNKGAVCLDGSPARYYINPSSTNPYKFAMFIQGGGWCSGLYNSNGDGFDSCWDRTHEKDGSTKNDPNTYDLNVPFLENNPISNPLLYSWTKIFVRYCDGASFSGDVTEPLQHKKDTNKYLFFRGKRILDAVFESLIQNYNLSNATDFVFGGGSAGGLAAILHADYIANKYFDLNKTKFVAFSNIGFFIDYNGPANYSNGMKWVFKHQNVSSSILSPHCFEHNVNDISKCIFAQNIAGNITVPVFILNSKYDAWQAAFILGTRKSNTNLLNEYGRNFTRIIFDNVVSQNDKNGNIYGVYIDSCYYHQSKRIKYFNGLLIDNYTPGIAFKEFYESLGMNNARRVWYDSQEYPCDHCCKSTIKHTNNPSNSPIYYPSVSPIKYTTALPSKYPIEYITSTMAENSTIDNWYHSAFGRYTSSNIGFDIFMICLITIIGLFIIGILIWCGWIKGCIDIIWNTCCCGKYIKIEQMTADYLGGGHENNE